MLGACALAPFILFALTASHSYRDAFIQAQEGMGREAAALAEHLDRIFEVQAAVLDLFAMRLEGMAATEVAQSPALYYALHKRTNRDHLLHSVMVADTQGAVLASDPPLPGLRLGDRAYFKAALYSDDIVISPPLQSRVTDQTIMPVARRWAGGIVSVTLAVPQIEAMLAERTGGEPVAITLLGGDGGTLLQWPHQSNAVFRGPALLAQTGLGQAGSVWLEAPSWGDALLVCYGMVGHYPLAVALSMRRAAILEAWLRNVIPHFLLATVATALLLIVVRMILRRDLEATTAMASGMAEAARANRAVSHFLDAANHDLCQPLQGARLYLDVLDGRLSHEPDRAVLRQALIALEGAEAIVSALRRMSLLDAGLVLPRPRDTAIGDILASLMGQFADTAVSRGLRLRAVSSSVWVHTDPDLLRDLLCSLLANALAFTPSGRVLMGGRVRRGMLRVEVWDTGIGIAPEHLDAVFEDFVQLGNPERDRRKGLGLGLGVVRRLSKVLEITCGVASIPGRGSVFWVMLPLAAPS